MSFSQGVLRLVRISSPTEPEQEPASAAVAASVGAESFVVLPDLDTMESAAAALSYLEPGFSDIEAAVALVEMGYATRIILTGFPSWPGLLWQASQLAEAAGVDILPTVVRPGGRVDIVITRDQTENG